MAAKLSYDEAVEVYALAVLHETNRQNWNFWALLKPEHKLVALDEVLRVLLIAEEYEKASDIQELIETLK